MRATPPVLGLARRMFQHRFGQSSIEVDKQRSMDEKRFPPPGLCITGDLSAVYRDIGSPFRRPDDAEGVENRADEICPQAEGAFQVETGGHRGHKRIVQHAGSLEHRAAARGALEHVHAQPRACGFIHHQVGTFAGPQDHGGGPAPPESQNMPSRLPSRARQLVINRKIFTHGPSRPANDIQH